jgi:hypothetical protein
MKGKHMSSDILKNDVISDTIKEFFNRPLRVVVEGDLHCGHYTGTTHPDFDLQGNAFGGKTLREIRRQIWDHYVKILEELQPIDILVVNGDLIDGQGERSSGTEEFFTDRRKQAEMAIAALEVAKARQIYLTYGTPYHTGKAEDFEEDIAKHFGAIIQSRLSLDVNGLRFGFRHHVGNSSLPHTRHTAVARERLLDLITSLNDETKPRDVICRSHVHHFDYCGGVMAGKVWLGMTTPALQGSESKYGSRYSSGQIDIGLVSFDVNPDSSYTWSPHIFSIQAQKAKDIVIRSEMLV